MGTTFRAINDLPGSLYPLLWPFQQLGALFIGPIVALFAAVLRRYRLAVAALLVALVMLTRVFVGAHDPLDVVCGAALGAALAGLANLLLGVPSSTDEQGIVSRG